MRPIRRRIPPTGHRILRATKKPMTSRMIPRIINTSPLRENDEDEDEYYRAEYHPQHKAAGAVELHDLHKRQREQDRQQNEHSTTHVHDRLLCL
jgi:hypothetical protein